MKRRMMVFLVAVVAIGAVMLFPSYAGAVQLTPEEIGALNDTVFANATEIVTFKFGAKMNMNTTLEMLIGNETGVIEVTTWQYGKGVVELNETVWRGGGIMDMDTSIVNDTTGRKAKIIMTMSGDYLSMGTDFWYAKVYDWILSALLDNMGSPNMYEYFWVSKGLLNISGVKLLEDELVGGLNCSVLKITPNAGEFWEIVINQSERYYEYEEWQDLSGFGNHSIMNVSTTQWVAKDTGFPVKTITTMRTMVSPNTEEEFRMTREIKHEMRFYDYNEPVSLDTTPEEPDSPESPPIGWPW